MKTTKTDESKKISVNIPVALLKSGETTVTPEEIQKIINKALAAHLISIVKKEEDPGTLAGEPCKATYSNENINTISAFPLRRNATKEAEPNRIITINGEETAISEYSLDIDENITLYFRQRAKLSFNAIRALDLLILPHIAAHMDNRSGHISESYLNIGIKTSEYKKIFNLSDQKSARASLVSAMNELYSLMFIVRGQITQKAKNGRLIKKEYIKPHISIFAASEIYFKDGTIRIKISPDFCEYLHKTGFIVFLPPALFRMNICHDQTAIALGRFLCSLYSIRRDGCVSLTKILNQNFYTVKEEGPRRFVQFVRTPFIADLLKLIQTGVINSAKIEDETGKTLYTVKTENTDQCTISPADFKRANLRFSMAWYPALKDKENRKGE